MRSHGRVTRRRACQLYRDCLKRVSSVKSRKSSKCGVVWAMNKINSYEIPEDCLIIPGSQGRHWEHLKSSEQLARAMWQCRSFSIYRLYEAGGISDGFQDEPEGLVALRARDGRLLLMGSFIAGGVQWPSSPAADSSIAIREEYASEIDFLQTHASEFLPVASRAAQLAI